MKYLWVLFLLTLSCAGAWGQCSFPAQSTTNPTINPQFFGQGYLNSADTPLQVNYGTHRAFADQGNVPTMWYFLNPQDPANRSVLPTDPSNPGYAWGNIDARLAELKTQESNVTCVLYTFYGTPQWDVSSLEVCSENNNQDHHCIPPMDIASNGSTVNGAMSSVFNFNAAMEAHVHANTYLQTHAYIGMVEVWNEINSSDTLNPSWPSPCSSDFCYWEGTYDQVRRIAEDIRCAWTGKGSIHVNGFAQGAQTVSCNWQPKNANTLIGSPSVVSDTADNRSVLCNFLYGNLGVTSGGICGGPPINGSNPSGDMAHNINHGADMIGAVLYHPYTGGEGTHNPESVYHTQLPAIVPPPLGNGFLQPNEVGKPLMASEWGATDMTSQQTDGYTIDGQIADIARRPLAVLAYGTSLSVEWEYDSSGLGTELNPQSPCTLQSGKLNCLGVASNQVYSWLAGKTFDGCVNNPNSSTPGVILCNLKDPQNSNYQGQIAWDCGGTLPGCGTATNSDITDLDCTLSDFNNAQCGMTTNPSPPSNSTQWRDLSGGTAPCSLTGCSDVKIGRKPILIEN